MALEICKNCCRTIGKLEQPCIWQGHVVCQECRKRLEGSSPSPHYQKRESKGFIKGVLATTLIPVAILAIVFLATVFLPILRREVFGRWEYAQYNHFEGTLHDPNYKPTDPNYNRPWHSIYFNSPDGGLGAISFEDLTKKTHIEITDDWDFLNYAGQNGWEFVEAKHEPKDTVIYISTSFLFKRRR